MTHIIFFISKHLIFMFIQTAYRYYLISFFRCATEVFNNRTVIDGRWGDCDEGCPGASNLFIKINTFLRLHFELSSINFVP
jgi:hypothetical protein